MKNFEGAITKAKGFHAAVAAAGIKYKDRLDMAMIYSEVPCAVAGTFTRNLVKAAPVKWDKKIVQEEKRAQAVVINAGIANACTGEEGMRYCEETAQAVTERMQVPKEMVLVASTGVIGMQLPMERLVNGVDLLCKDLAHTPEKGHQAATAIMTTDTHPKEVCVSFTTTDGKEVTVGGMCKGSGMIHPDMCTMLGFATTDFNISQPLLQEALSANIDQTFNMVSVDGDTSTNDTFLVLANGLAGNEMVTEKNEDYEKFAAALLEVNTELAKMMAGDGEGATALFEVEVIHAKTKQDAVLISKSVITSSLTKAAIFGHDANWGRILCAMGYSGGEFDPEIVDLFFESKAGRIQIMKAGVGTDYSEEEATKILSEPEVKAICDLKQGEASAVAWGCDLSYDYVKINADYRS